MSFLRSFSITSQKKNPFPFNVSAVQFAKEIELDNKVTIFVGDNGSGKSTLLETIAMSLNLPLIGGFISERPGFEAARILQQYLHIEWQHQTNKGFFFQAETSAIS
jgi:predicted ATPase